jgi:hypothetical protein
MRRPLSSVPRNAARAALVAAALAVVLAAASCGATATHYANAAYGFSLTIDRPFVEWRTASTGVAAAFQVAFIDPQGAQIGGRHLDSLTVSVVKTGDTPSADQNAQLRASLRALGARMIGALGQDVRITTPSDVSLNGVSGVVLPYAATIAGKPVVGWEYLLAARGRVYTILAGAAADHWKTDEPVFRRAISSFKAS